MALTPSTMLPLGTELPDFTLPDTVSGKQVSSRTLHGKLTLIGFICNHCPYVLHIVEALSKACQEFQKQDVAVVLVSSNDAISYPQDGPEKMKEFAAKYNFSFPYCYDETQEIAKIFDAACTPEFYLFNGDQTLIYRGQFDASRPGNAAPVDGADLKEAVSLGLKGKILDDQHPSVGCNIKWRP